MAARTKTPTLADPSPEQVGGGSNLVAARSGDAKRALEVLRDTLAGLLDTTESQVHAQLAAQYRATLADLAALSDGKEGSAADDAASRIALRLAHSNTA